METRIILAKVKGQIERPFLEAIEEQVYKSEEALIKELCEHGGNDCMVMTLSDFMDAFNNEEIRQASWWMGYVTIDPSAGEYCPRCGSDNIFKCTDPNEANADCFQCGGCNVLLPNDELVRK